MDRTLSEAPGHPPIPAREPNATTLKAMQELEEGRGKRFAGVLELLADIGA